MATPAIAGAAALVRQYLMEGYYPTGILHVHWGTFVGQKNASNSMASPPASLLKAILIHSSQQLKARQTTSRYIDDWIPIKTRPSLEGGWGRVQLNQYLYPFMILMLISRVLFFKDKSPFNLFLHQGTVSKSEGTIIYSFRVKVWTHFNECMNRLVIPFQSYFVGLICQPLSSHQMFLWMILTCLFRMRMSSIILMSMLFYEGLISNSKNEFDRYNNVETITLLPINMNSYEQNEEYLQMNITVKAHRLSSNFQVFQDLFHSSALGLLDGDDWSFWNGLWAIRSWRLWLFKNVFLYVAVCLFLFDLCNLVVCVIHILLVDYSHPFVFKQNNIFMQI